MPTPEKVYPQGIKHGELHDGEADPIPNLAEILANLTEILTEIRDQFKWQEGEDPAYKDANFHKMLYSIKYAVDYWGDQICKRLDTIIAKL